MAHQFGVHGVDAARRAERRSCAPDHLVQSSVAVILAGGRGSRLMLGQRRYDELESSDTGY